MQANPAQPTRARSWGLDAIRALASLAVVASHYGAWWIGVVPPAIALVHLLGHMGVEAFFVLSGFLIGGTLLRERPHNLAGLLGFWARRALRTLPVFVLVVLVYAALHPPSQGNAPLWQYLSFTAFMPMLGAHRPDVWLSVSWSLAVEEWAYLLVPPLVVLATWRGIGATPVLVAVLAALLSCRWTLVWMGLPPADLMLGTPFRADPILWGMLAAQLGAGMGGRQTMVAGIAGGLACTVFALVWLAGFATVVQTPLFHTLGWSVLDLGLAASMGSLAALRCPHRLIQRPVAVMAALSYPVYLLHLPLAHALGLWPVGAAQAAINTTLASLATLGGAALVHRLVERPCMALGRGLCPAPAHPQPPGGQE